MNQEILDLRKTIKDCEERIKTIQSSCPHPKGHLFYKPCGSSGNWDRDDAYWYEWKCTICDARWETDQDYKLVLAKPHAIEFKKIIVNEW